MLVYKTYLLCSLGLSGTYQSEEVSSISNYMFFLLPGLHDGLEQKEKTHYWQGAHHTKKKGSLNNNTNLNSLKLAELKIGKYRCNSATRSHYKLIKI